MDAYAYLIRHGWSGPGNPLNPDRVGTRGGLGLTKPLLVARRSGNSGIGKTTTKDPTNQWWLRGFEDALKGFGTEQKDTGVVGKGNALTSELYRHFVRGETVPGTLGGKDKDENKKEKGKEQEQSGKKRKRGEDTEKESKEEKRVRREEKRARKEEKVKRRAEKEERRRAKAEKREAKTKRAEEKAARKSQKAEEKEKRKEKKPEDDYPTPVSMDLDSTDAQDSGSALDVVKPKKLKTKEETDKKTKESKKEKVSKEHKKEKNRDSSDESSKRKSKKSKST